MLNWILSLNRKHNYTKIKMHFLSISTGTSHALDCASLSLVEWGISVMAQQSSYPVELTGELLKAESLKDGQHDSQVIKCWGHLTVKITDIMDIWMSILYICMLLELNDCNLSIGKDLMHLTYKNLYWLIIILHKLQKLKCILKYFIISFNLHRL